MRFHCGISFRFKDIVKYLKWLGLILFGLFAFIGIGKQEKALALTPSNNSYYCLYYADGTRSCDSTKAYTKNNQSYFGPRTSLNTLYDWENIIAWHTDFYNQSFCQGNTSGGLLQFRIYTSHNFIRTPVKRVAVTVGYGNQIACNTSFSLNGDYTLAECLIPQGFQNQTFTTIVVLNDDLYFADIGLTTDIGISSWNINNCNVGPADIIDSNNRNTRNIIDNDNRNTDKIIQSNQQQTQVQQQTYDYLTDNTPPSVDTDDIGSVGGLLPPGPVDSLLNIPVKYLNKTISSLGGTCSPFTFNFVFDEDITLPCFGTFYDEFPVSVKIFTEYIPAGFILILYFKHLYKKVDRATSLKTSSDDEWGVI